MKKKTIQQILSKKFNEWGESIEDEHVKNLVKNNTVITGGCIASMLLGEEVNDYDLYFTNKETTLAVAEYYVKKFNEKHEFIENQCGYQTKAFVLDGDKDINKQISEKSYEGYNWKSRMINNLEPGRIKIIVRSDGVAGELPQEVELMESGDEINAEELEKHATKKYEPIFLSSNAVTLSGKIQLVIRFYGMPEEIHNNYDYIHCTNYWMSHDKKVTTNIAALESLMAKELFYHGSKYPVSSIIRLRKFLKRGWTINAGQILKIAFQVSRLDLNNIDVLEDQLMGVDTLYFMHLIKQLAEAFESRKKEGQELDLQGYAVTIIDKIFG